MAFSIKHLFSNPKSDGVDTTITRPSDWNASHVISMNAGKIMGRDNSGNGNAQELPLSFNPAGDPDFTAAVGSLGMPTGATSDRPVSPRDGSFRFNTTLSALELWFSAAWHQVLSSLISATTTMVGAAFNEAVRVDVASAATCDIGAAASNYIRITGVTTITALGTIASGARRHVVFGGTLTLTHNATSLILPNNGNNIVTAAGDAAIFLSEGSGNWRCVDYQRANGQLLGVLTSITNSLGANVALSSTASYFTGPRVAQGTTGTWSASGTVTVVSASFSAYYAKLWDGTTVVASTSVTGSTAGGSAATIPLSGVITNPVGDLRISVRNITATDGSILFNLTGESKDSTLTAVRIG